MKTMRVFPALVVAIPAGLAAGVVPAYEVYELAARANFSGSYNVPDGEFFSNATPSLSDSAGISASTAGSEAVWYDDGTMLGSGGALLYVSTGFISDVSLNENGQVVTEQIFSSQDGVYLATAMGAGPAFATNLFSGYSSPQINDGGRIAYRGRTGSGAQFFASDVIGGGLSPAIHVAEVGVSGASPYSFLFTPSLNGNDQIAGKARRGAAGVFGESQPDEIRVWNADGSSVLIAEDRDANASSAYLSFDNSVSLTDSGRVAFIARLAATGDRGVFLSDGTTTTTIASEADAALSSIEFFRPAANDAGLVAFRAMDAAGRRAVFVGNGTSLVAVATTEDVLATDLGPARLGQETASSPTFGGGPAINTAGDIAFTTGVTPAGNSQIEWGTAIFVARATAPGGPDLDADGSVGASDLAILLAAWGACAGCPADLDGDGSVGASDLAVLLAAWG